MSAEISNAMVLGADSTITINGINYRTKADMTDNLGPAGWNKNPTPGGIAKHAQHEDNYADVNIYIERSRLNGLRRLTQRGTNGRLPSVPVVITDRDAEGSATCSGTAHIGPVTRNDTRGDEPISYAVHIEFLGAVTFAD